MSVEVEADEYDHLIGQTLANRYLVETRLGEGAMGIVYRAKHVKVGRAFALKVLHSRLLEDDKVLQRFEREAELAGRLRHPNVIGVVDVGETPEGLRYMVMDFAEGPDLATLLSEAPMPPPRIIHLVRQLLEGLFHAHEQGLIHRDFKPENVIVERDTHGSEVPRIVDFGIAILREGGDSPAGPGRLTTNGLVLGTPHYMAPEQAVADPIDHRIDLFALGIMIYEMLSGKLPFDGSGAEVARANLMLDPPAIAERVPYLEVDPLLEAFARRLMAKRRDARPATAKVARDLLDLIEKDREAAAAALGVSLGVVQKPMVTQESKPIRYGSGDGTFPPPIRDATETPSQVPSMTGANHSAERAIATDPSDALAPPRRRGPIIGAAIAGMAILGVAAVVLMSGGSPGDAKPAAPSEQVAEAATPTPTPPPEPAPSPEPAPATVEVPEPAAVDEPVEAQPAEVPPDEPTPPEPAVAKKPSAKQRSKPITRNANAGKQPVETTSTQTAPPPIDAAKLASQYKAVGAQLKALEDARGSEATSDLWPRYRFIRLSDAMTTQQKRDQAAAILTKLTRDIAARKK